MRVSILKTTGWRFLGPRETVTMTSHCYNVFAANPQMTIQGGLLFHQRGCVIMGRHCVGVIISVLYFHHNGGFGVCG